jgi:hypothetical protein
MSPLLNIVEVKVLDFLRSNRAKKKKILREQRQIVLGLRMEMQRHLKEGKSRKDRAEISSEYNHDIYMEQMILDSLGTELFLSKHRKLRIVLPTKEEESPYWYFHEMSREWTLTPNGFAHLEDLFQGARMRRVQRFSVRCCCSDGDGVGLKVSTIDSGHLGALHGWEEGSHRPHQANDKATRKGLKNINSF